MEWIIAVCIWWLQFIHPMDGDYLRTFTPHGCIIHEDGSGDCGPDRVLPAYDDIDWGLFYSNL